VVMTGQPVRVGLFWFHNDSKKYLMILSSMTIHIIVIGKAGGFPPWVDPFCQPHRMCTTSHGRRPESARSLMRTG
jgi:hypothetical protein